MTNNSRPDIRLSQTTNSEEITVNKLHTKQIWVYQYYNFNFANTLLVILIKNFFILNNKFFFGLIHAKFF